MVNAESTDGYGEGKADDQEDQVRDWGKIDLGLFTTVNRSAIPSVRVSIIKGSTGWTYHRITLFKERPDRPERLHADEY
jgi:hypothetical protein